MKKSTTGKQARSAEDLRSLLFARSCVLVPLGAALCNVKDTFESACRFFHSSFAFPQSSPPGEAAHRGQGVALPWSLSIFGRRSPRMRATRIKPRVKRASFASETLGQREGNRKPTEWAPDSATSSFNARFRSPAPRVPIPFHHDTQGSAMRLAALRRSASPWALFESPAFAGLTVRNRLAKGQIPGQGSASRGKAPPFRRSLSFSEGCALPSSLAFACLVRTAKPANAGDSNKAQGGAERRSGARRVAEPWVPRLKLAEPVKRGIEAAR